MISHQGWILIPAMNKLWRWTFSAYTKTLSWWERRGLQIDFAKSRWLDLGRQTSKLPLVELQRHGSTWKLSDSNVHKLWFRIGFEVSWLREHWQYFFPSVIKLSFFFSFVLLFVLVWFGVFFWPTIYTKDGILASGSFRILLECFICFLKTYQGDL